MAKINFFSEETDFTPKHKAAIRDWITAAADQEGFSIRNLNYVFCSDAYLLDMNKQYLDHDTLTDIITFDNSEKQGRLEGDIFISIERVEENARVFETSSTEELHRVMIHGLLHLCGFGDQDDAEKMEMTAKEDYYLGLRSSNLRTNIK